MSFKQLFVAVAVSLATLVTWVVGINCFKNKVGKSDNSNCEINLCNPPAPPNHTNLSVFSGIKYGEDDRHTLDIYLPNTNNYPVVMFVHGGSWESGSKDIYGSLGHMFSKQGIGCVVINYRLSPQVKHPAHIEDVARAFAWTNNNISRYGGDPERIYLMGHSAGGHLVALLGTNEQYLLKNNLSKTKIKGVIAISGMYDFNLLVLKWAGLSYIFPTAADRNAASPLRHVKPDSPPFMIVYAQKDLTTFEGHAKDLHRTMSKAGVKSTLLMVPNRDHFTILFEICDPKTKSNSSIISFIK